MAPVSGLSSIVIGLSPRWGSTNSRNSPDPTALRMYVTVVAVGEKYPVLVVAGRLSSVVNCQSSIVNCQSIGVAPGGLRRGMFSPQTHGSSCVRQCCRRGLKGSGCRPSGTPLFGRQLSILHPLLSIVCDNSPGMLATVVAEKSFSPHFSVRFSCINEPRLFSRPRCAQPQLPLFLRPGNEIRT